VFIEETMNFRFQFAILALVANVALAADHPYGGISARNVFNLAAPKPETSKPGEVFIPAPEYKLTGIAGFGSQKWALLSKADPGKPAQPFVLRQGESDGAIEVLEIDEIASLVRIRNEGVLVELRFTTNTTPNADALTRAFVDQHTRAHEGHQRREAQRIARERAEAERLTASQRLTEPAPPFSAPKQAILEHQ
jgi:hypothetical protein